MSLGERDPQTRLAAQMSLPYGVAVALVTGRASLAEYEPHRLADSAVREMIGRIRMSVDPAIDENTEPYVTVITTDGRRLQGHEPIGLGDPRNALPEDAIVAKFDDLAPRALAGGAVERLRDAVLTLPAPGSLARLLDALGSPRVAD
jgi:2-methylcitrate dehydratase PrpD